MSAVHAALLAELREEMRDWQDDLAGQREGLDELCERVDAALAANPNDWIPVTERLPTHNYSVIAWITAGGFVVPGDTGMRDIVSYIEGKGWCQFVGDDEDAIVTVSHWQDMPEPPVPLAPGEAG